MKLGADTILMLICRDTRSTAFRNNFLDFWQCNCLIFDLLQITSVDLLDKRGYLTICLHLSKEGSKILLRKPEGIREWHEALKVRFICKLWGNPQRGERIEIFFFFLASFKIDTRQQRKPYHCRIFSKNSGWPDFDDPFAMIFSLGQSQHH